MISLEKKNVLTLINSMLKHTSVVMPVKRKDDEWDFGTEKEGKIDFNYPYTVTSIKSLFLPPREQTFVFNKQKNKVLPQEEEKPFVVFGLNLRDTEALIQLDEVMTKPNPDYFYLNKRNCATIVSIVNGDDYTPHIGIDLILENANSKEYKVVPLTDKGRKIAKNKFFKNKGDIKFAKNQVREKTMPELRKMLLDSELLHDAVKWSWKGYPKIWDELSKECLGCGICAYVCPLCFCFSIEDVCSLDDKTCAKSRCWTACTLPEFSKITGGHNFHPTLKERYYNWFYHKFVRAYGEYGKSLCVACGRCQKYCPAGIDIEKILIDIIKNYKSSRSDT